MRWAANTTSRRQPARVATFRQGSLPFLNSLVAQVWHGAARHLHLPAARVEFVALQQHVTLHAVRQLAVHLQAPPADTPRPNRVASVHLGGC